MKYKFPPNFESRLTSLDGDLSMLAAVGKRRTRVREALKSGPKSAAELVTITQSRQSHDDNPEEAVVKILKGLIEDGQVYLMASSTKHKRYALTPSGMAHA